MFLKRLFTKFFQLHNMPHDQPPPLWTVLVSPIHVYMYKNMICIENLDNFTNQALLFYLF